MKKIIKMIKTTQFNNLQTLVNTHTLGQFCLGNNFNVKNKLNTIIDM